MNKKIIAIVLSACFVVSGFVYYGQQSVSVNSFQEYVTVRHKSFCMKQFKDHQWLLFADPNPQFDHILDTMSPNIYDLKHQGKMKIKVLYRNNEPTGFVTYYMQTQYQGKILFLAVDKNFHGTGCGRALMLHAIEELTKMGAKTIKLFTRNENIPAQKLYESLGFVREDADDVGIFYRKKVA